MDFAQISSNPQSLLRAISPLPSTWRSTFDLMSFSLLQNEKKNLNQFSENEPTKIKPQKKKGKITNPLYCNLALILKLDL